MADDTDDKGARRAAALRANLQRRKTRARAATAGDRLSEPDDASGATERQ